MICHINNSCRGVLGYWNKWTESIGGDSQTLGYMKLRFQRWYRYLWWQSLNGILGVNYWDGVEEKIDYDCGLFILFKSDGIFEALACTSYHRRSWWYRGKEDSILCFKELTV